MVRFICFDMSVECNFPPSLWNYDRTTNRPTNRRTDGLRRSYGLTKHKKYIFFILDSSFELQICQSKLLTPNYCGNITIKVCDRACKLRNQVLWRWYSRCIYKVSTVALMMFLVPVCGFSAVDLDRPKRIYFLKVEAPLTMVLDVYSRGFQISAIAQPCFAIVWVHVQPIDRSKDKHESS